MIRYFTGLFLVFWTTTLWASIEVSHGLSHKNATLGQEIQYSRIVTANVTDIIEPVVFENEIWGPFTIKRTRQESTQVDNKKVVRFDAIVAAFELGDVMWPSQNITVIRNNKEESTVLPPLTLTIAAQIKPGQNVQPRDIKPPLALPFPTKSWLIIISIVLLLSLAAWIMYKRYFIKNVEVDEKIIEEKDMRSPYEIATEDLNILYKQNFIEKNELKRHYLQLTEILKRYIEAQLSVSILEKTSRETIAIIAGKLDSQTESRLKNIFAVADFVKYAKLTPTEQDHQDTKTRVYNVIERLKDVDK